jgi:uncharacterized lipoprotein YddW (UPF0748 family)
VIGLIEGRALWCGLGDFREYPKGVEDIDRLIGWCNRVHVNILLPNVFGGSLASYTGSRLVPTNRTFEGWDALKLLIEKAHENDMEVHPWIVVANQGSILQAQKGKLSREGTELLQVKHPDWFCTDRYGFPMTQLPFFGSSYDVDLGKAEVRRFIANIAREIVETYPEVDGIHLDYIRFRYWSSKLTLGMEGSEDLSRPIEVGDWIWVTRKWRKDPTLNDLILAYQVTKIEKGEKEPYKKMAATLEREHTYCYCDRCLQAFQADENLTIPSHLKTTQERADWIHQEHMDNWVKWRAEQVTKQVREIRKALRKADPKKMLSAAVFQNVEEAIQTVGQDWISWAKEGLLDFVNPMVYWVPPETVEQRTADYLKRIEGKCPIYPGILTSTDFNVPVENVKKYVQGIREAGGHGITLFCYATWSNEHRIERGHETIQDYDEALKGVFKEKAKRPHSRTKT